MIDLETGAPIRPEAEPSAMSFHIAYSPDGAKILTSSGDGSVPLGRLVGTTERTVPDRAVHRRGHLPPDGHTARIVGWYSGDPLRLEHRIDSALDFACTVVGREFTAQEWRDTFGDRPYSGSATPDRREQTHNGPTSEDVGPFASKIAVTDRR